MDYVKLRLKLWMVGERSKLPKSCVEGFLPLVGVSCLVEVFFPLVGMSCWVQSCLRDASLPFGSPSIVLLISLLAMQDRYLLFLLVMQVKQSKVNKERAGGERVFFCMGFRLLHVLKLRIHPTPYVLLARGRKEDDKEKETGEGGHDRRPHEPGPVRPVPLHWPRSRAPPRHVSLSLKSPRGPLPSVP